ncbi:MAG: DHH family phosphoesterase [Clostridiales Family XIII bacterium]|jgi:c-di-AMP phosphodiesterase-like protein|nr:DHH family phosphoesterase [Clostridiales Family XIII bacterium]
MGDKILNSITSLYLRWIVVMSLIFSGGLLYFHRIAGVVAFGLSAAAFGVLLILRSRQRIWVTEYLEEAVGEIDETMRHSVMNHPLPLCIVNSEGRIVLANRLFKELYPDTVITKSEFNSTVGIELKRFSPGEYENLKYIEAGGRFFRVVPVYMKQDEGDAAMLYWLDVTEFEELKVRYRDEKKCFAHIQVDNYDELLSNSPDDKRSLIAAGIEKAIRQWAGGMDASIVRYYTSKYFVVFESRYYEKLVKEKFSILDEARLIETDADFPVSLSMGIGVGGATPARTDEYSTFALDLALGRGGDQAVVKRGDIVDYYGGTLDVIERRNKGKSRVMAHAFRRLIEQSSKVIVMGHKYPDIDSFASAVGIARIVMNRGHDAYIVINEVNDSLSRFFNAAVDSKEYNFMNSEEAYETTMKNALLVVVDTNRPSLTEAPGLFERVEKTVVFDHHRKTEEYIENATLTYMEPSASSTSELVTEVMQYMADKKSILRLEAEMLLGGVIVDTNSFSVKTGTRTFEAASWLRRNGAETSTVRQYLQDDIEDYKKRSGIIMNAQFLEGGIAISINRSKDMNVQIINAQAADELLDIKGTRASFVIGETKSEVIISARSLGEINVQTIMEKLGGGGHLTMAAAQIHNMSVDETLEKLKTVIKEAMPQLRRM